jgi:pimeloyl-ACP methyl ester carboxylesterase
MTADQAAVGSSTVDLPQGTLAYRVAGPASSDQPPVVFVHGLLVDARLWDPVARLLAARGIRSYAPTLPLGAHRHPMKAGADLSPRGIAGLVGHFIQALGLTGVVLAGNDTGGAICQIMLGGETGPLDGTAPVRAAVLTDCDAFGTFPPLPLAPLFRLLRHPGLVAGIVPALRSQAVRHSPLAFGPLAKRGLDPALTLDWIQPLGDREIRLDIARFARQVRPRILLDAAARFGQFTGPVRVLWGEGDRYFPTTLGRRLSESFPDAVFTTVPAARTFLPLDHPSQVASEVTAVLPGSHQGLS